MDPDSGPFFNLTFTYPGSGSEDAPPIKQTIRLPLFVTWEIVEVIQLLGYERALIFANFSVMVSKAGMPGTPQLNNVEQFQLQATIKELATLFGHRWGNLEDRVLAFTYELLRNTSMDRKMAAEFAAVKLKKGPADDAWREAWRKRVDRWAKSHKLPPIGKPRKPRKVITMR